VKFNDLVKLLEKNGFTIVKEKGSIRYYGKSAWDKLVRIDFHGSKEVPKGTCAAILKSAGIERK
jgi:predicted RNA binding protein YcfA (HicA-like mRNA interferase family)